MVTSHLLSVEIRFSELKLRREEGFQPRKRTNFLFWAWQTKVRRLRVLEDLTSGGLKSQDGVYQRDFQVLFEVGKWPSQSGETLPFEGLHQKQRDLAEDPRSLVMFPRSSRLLGGRGVVQAREPG